MNRLLLAFTLLVAPLLGAVNARNGIAISTSSTINGVTPNSEINGIALPGGLQPETSLWVSRVIAAGGTFEADSIDIADALVIALKAEDFYANIVHLMPLLGSNLAAARVPLIDTLNVGIATNENLLDADFSQATGLQGNGSNKALNLLINPADLNASTDDGGIFYWELAVDFTGSSDNCPIGTRNFPGGTFFMLELYSTNVGAYWGSIANAAISAGTATNGSYYAQRASATSRSIDRDGVSSGTNTNSDSPSMASLLNIYLLGQSRVSLATVYWKGRAGCSVLTDGGLSAAQATTLHNIIDAELITPTGR